MLCHASDCENELTPPKRKYCSDRCRNRVYSRQRRATVREAKAEARSEPTRIRRGTCYEQILELSLFDVWADGELTYEGVRDWIESERGTRWTLPTVISALQAVRIDRRLSSMDDEWTMSEEMRGMLMLEPPPTEDPAELDAWLDRATAAFLAFEARFFRTPRGPYLRRPFHIAWIRATLRAIVLGGKLLILAPPRHGKSELLTHFCVWLIARDPDIRILWVGGNKDIAGDMVSSVRDTLENNKPLIEATLPPSKSYAPRRRSGAGREWQQTKFTVNCREAIGTKAPTMVALGRAGKILSKDVDFLIADDIEDFDSTDQPGTREKTRTWFQTQLDSRVEEHTAWVTIGSRQHPDDIYAYLLDDDTWETIVDRAHDPACPYDPERIGDHTVCMLFPEIRTYRWLEQKRQSFRTLGIEALFDMVYLNDPAPEGVVFWTREKIEAAHNRTRGLGLPDENVKLIGGLDPSATKFQAAFLWGLGVTSLTTYMIDLDNRVGGGVDPFLRVAERWRIDYNLRHWVIEANLYRKGFFDDPRVLDWCAQHSIIIEPHETNENKHDEWFGVGAMRRLYETDPPSVDLPCGTSEARSKTELYTTQMLRFTDDAKRLRKLTTDVLMASWFPQMVLRRWKSEMLAARDGVDDENVQSFAGFDVSDYSREDLWR